MFNPFLGRMTPEQITSLADKIPDMRLKVGQDLYKQTHPDFIGKDGNPLKFAGPVDPGFYTDRGLHPLPALPRDPGLDLNPIRIGGPVPPPQMPMPARGLIPPTAPVSPVGGGMIRPQPAPPRFGGIRRVIGR